MSVLTVNSRIQIPHEEFEFSFARSGGPGGQNVNKVNSKALLRWPVVRSATLPADVRSRFLAKYQRRLTGQGEVLITSQRYRDQGRNVADCLEKLRELLLAVAVRPTVRRRTKPTRAAVAPAGRQTARIVQEAVAQIAAAGLKNRRQARPVVAHLACKEGDMEIRRDTGDDEDKRLEIRDEELSDDMS